MSERNGVEIDYCPDCRGVWLDRGELDKILDRAENESRAAAPEPSRNSAPPAQAPRFDDRSRGFDPNFGYGSTGGDRGYGRNKKKGGWLGELFD